MTDWRGIPEDYRNKIVTGDARILAERIPDESVDLIFTDPPYPKEYLPLFEWLPEMAMRVLKTDGFLLSYVPPYYKNKIIGYFDKWLNYFWDFIEYNTGNSTIIWPRKIISRYKSIMCYRKSNGLPVTNVLGVLPGDGGDKRFHKWGQSEQTARYFIECFKRTGIVLDPFAGAGTALFVCKQLDYSFIGFEIDPETAELARARVDGTLPMPRNTQMAFPLPATGDER